MESFGRARLKAGLAAWLVLLLPAAMLACLMFPGAKVETPWTPETPTEYTAEVQKVWDVFVVIDENGNVTPDLDGLYGAEAKMRYVLRFSDVGDLVPGQGMAMIYKVYTPQRIVTIKNPENYSEEEKQSVYARSGFPTTEVKLHELTFSGGPEGKFIGTNSETGKDIFGHMEWNQKLLEMHVIFTEDIQQDYLVISDEPFYNWP